MLSKILFFLIIGSSAAQAQFQNIFASNLGKCQGVQKSCQDYFLRGCRESRNYKISMVDGSVKSLYCKMINSDADASKIGGWTAVIKDPTTDLTYMSNFGSTANIAGTFYSNPNYGITWGANDDKVKAFPLSNFTKYSKGMITFTGWYDSTDGVSFGNTGLGLLFISTTSQQGIAWNSAAHVNEVFNFGDGNAQINCYQGLTVNGVLQGTTGTICGGPTVGTYVLQVVDRTDVLNMPLSTAPYYIQITGYTSAYVYNRRLIREFLVK